jgi:mono/diheme cytochrome c family protein
MSGRRYLVCGALLATIVVAPISMAAAQTGKQDYETYCADCHGADGKGNGPANQSFAMSTKPPDITLLAARHGGKFPFDEVVDIVDGRKAIPSHERLEMPFFAVKLQNPGEGFNPASDAAVKKRIDAIVTYVGSLQAK